MKSTVPAFLLALSLLLAAGCAAAHKAPLEPQKEPQRFGTVIALKPEKLAYYKELHANAWPGVLEKITACNIRNYSIYLRELEPGKHYLFSYFEYVGDDFDADMQRMAADAETQRWWKETDPCQMRIPAAGNGEWWSAMDEVFHHD